MTELSQREVFMDKIFKKSHFDRYRLFGSILIIFFLTFIRLGAWAQDADLKFKNITSEQGLAQSTIHGIAKDKYGFMWFGTWGGLCRYDGYTFKTYRYNPDNNKSINNNMIHNVIKDTDDRIWVLTFSKNELCRYNYERDDFDRIPLSRLSPSFLKMINRRNHLLTVNYSYKNYKWMIDTSSISLARLDLNSGQVKKYKYNAANPWSLNGSNVSDLYMDNDNLLWVGTYSYGINKANLNGKPFDYYYHDPFTSASLIDNNVSAICEDNSGKLWVGTRDNGISVIGKNGYRHITKSPTTIVDNQIRSIFCDSRGTIWIGTKLGLNNYDSRTNSFQHITGLGLKNISVYSVTEDNEHNVWIGTWQGIYQYNPIKKELKHFNPDKTLKYPWVRTIIQDRKQQLWVGTEGGGISILKPVLNKDTFEVVKHLLHQDKGNSISDNRVYCIYQDNEGLIWIGTGNGLDIYDPSKNIIIHFSRQSGLADATIAGITEDKNGFMWISHKKGISRLNKKTFKIRNYTAQDGLQSNEFSDGAVLKSRYKNRLFFGGNNGLNSFNPDSIYPEKTLPNTVLTELQILNHKVDINKIVNGRVVLTKPLYLTDKIQLNYGDKSVAIEFAGLHYSNPQGNRYAYKLEGFDKEWVSTDAGRRIATYSNLEPGKYTFKVISSNSDGIWNLKPATLNIVVKPPFWASIWAYIFYVTVLLLIFYTYHQYTTEFTRLQSKLSYESLIRMKENELHQIKLQFFTNISHEIKTPLTLILAPIERLLQMLPGNALAASQLTTMKSNGDRLLKLINQLLDFRKLETGNEALHLGKGNMIAFLSKAITQFEPLAEAKNLKLEFETALTAFECCYDEDKLEVVIANLLSNALKFTPELGWIKVRFSVRNIEAEKIAVIEVINSGRPIRTEDLEDIFQPFHRGSGHNVAGTGLGLAFSKGLIELHGGKITVNSLEKEDGFAETVFVVELPENPAEVLNIQNNNTETVSSAAVGISVDSAADFKATTAAQEKRVLVNDKIPVLLIVEDNVDLRKYLVEHFENLYNILEAENGLLGLQVAGQELPDLVISDVTMPQMDGFEFCKKLKSDLKTGHIPVILLTARSHEQDRIEGIETGAEDYITKPFSLDFLAARIKSLLQLREKLKEKYRREISLNAPDDLPSSPDEKLLKRMLLYIEECLANPDLSVDDICKEVGTSRANLYRKVKTMIGLSIVEVIKEIRLKRAKQLIKDRRFNVNEISYLVGFSDSNHFRKCFKAEFGLSPTEYRKIQDRGAVKDE
ncbi:Two component regulator propeller [Pedobacter sp. ok626]|nr:Two component regulator propeller [Pedobacter sp. ok626]